MPDHDTYSLEDRKVLTQSYDLSISTLFEQFDSCSIEVPKFQREYVWDNRRASRLIESLLLNIPIPVLYMVEKEDSKWEVIDGQQRIRSVVRYLKNEFALSSLEVLDEYNRLRFHQLPSKIQRHLKTRMMRAVLISAESSPDMKFEVFERLNVGSVKLAEQELRNSIYRGPFNSLLRDQVKNEDVRWLLGSKAPRKRMRDEEFLLRFFAVDSDPSGYKPPLKKYLNDFMKRVRFADADQLEEMTRRLHEGILRIRTLVGEHGPKPLTPDGEVKEVFNGPLIESLLVVLVRADWDIVDLDYLRKELKVLLTTDESFVAALEKATADRAAFRVRIQKVMEAVVAAGSEVPGIEFGEA